MEKDKNTRVLEIFFRALHGEDISVKRLAHKYVVSTKSINRDINDLQVFFSEHRELMQNAEFIYSHKEKAYILNSDEFLKNSEFFALVEIIIGSRALNKNDVLTLISKMKKFTTVKDRARLENLIRKEMYHYNEVKADCKSVINNIWKISQAIEEKQVITITYYKMDRSEICWKIKPTAIMFSEYYFYLIAYRADDADYKPVYFRIDRISEIIEKRGNFFIPPQNNFDEGDLSSPDCLYRQYLTGCLLQGLLKVKKTALALLKPK